MINVSLGNNEAYVTLSGRVVSSAPYLYLSLVEQSTQSNEIIASITDISTEAERVNRFELEIVSSSALADLTNAIVYITGGDYIYTIYGSEFDTLATFDKSSATVLEKGFLRYDTQSSQVDYTPTAPTKITYNG